MEEARHDEEGCKHQVESGNTLSPIDKLVRKIQWFDGTTDFARLGSCISRPGLTRERSGIARREVKSKVETKVDNFVEKHYEKCENGMF